jgi:hypothetical protein
MPVSFLLKHTYFQQNIKIIHQITSHGNEKWVTKPNEVKQNGASGDEVST